jgi:chemotaxis protein MotB
LMQDNGLRADQVSSVRGFADQQLRNAKDAEDPTNRRITVIVQYMTGSDKEKSMGTEKPKAAAEGEHKGAEKASPPGQKAPAAAAKEKGGQPEAPAEKPNPAGHKK